MMTEALSPVLKDGFRISLSVLGWRVTLLLVTSNPVLNGNAPKVPNSIQVLTDIDNGLHSILIGVVFFDFEGGGVILPIVLGVAGVRGLPVVVVSHVESYVA